MLRTAELGAPLTAREVFGTMNKIATDYGLRIFDQGMRLVNVMSLFSTLPSVIAAMAKQADETDSAWRGRTGAYTAQGTNDAFALSPVKTAIQGVHYFFSKDSSAMLQQAAARGYLDQSVAEMDKLYHSIGETTGHNRYRRFVDWASQWVDKSERTARAIAFASVYRAGKDALQLTDNAAMEFAHKQANLVIGDFMPYNRPLIFQGASGMPFGLFTTYMWNFNQRLLDALETKSYRPLLQQLALQHAFFGAESLPGWAMYSNWFADNYDGSRSPVDTANEVFGSAGADVFLNGTIANLPKLFGMDDGISIGPRIAMGQPFQSGINAPAFRFIVNIGRAFGRIIDNTRESGPDAVFAAQTLATANINKAFSNVIDLVTNNAVDKSGLIIEGPTRTLIGTTARVLGFKPLITDELRQESYRNRMTDAKHAALKDRLAESLKSQLRNGQLTQDSLDDALISYTNAGGRADGFMQFFASQVLRAGHNRMHIDMLDALSGNIDEKRVGRLLYLMRNE